MQGLYLGFAGTLPGLCIWKNQYPGYSPALGGTWLQMTGALSSPSIIQEDVINDTHFIINENGSSVDEAHRQQINSNFNIFTETKAKCVYTNAAQIQNKMNELDILISQENPDFIFVTEVLPKSTIFRSLAFISII